MHICTVIKDTVQSLWTERNKYDFKQDLNDDSDGAHLTSFGFNYQHFIRIETVILVMST